MKDRAPEPIFSGVQVPITTSFTHNIAFGAKTLIAKWNATPWVVDGSNIQNPNYLESWYYAVWAYNGFASSNNPANYSSLRGEYSCNNADGFNHDRRQFPYQELVFGGETPSKSGGGRAVALPRCFSSPSSLFLNCPPGCPNISVPQPVHGDPTSGTFPAPVTIDTQGSVQTQPFTLAGWAVDYTAQSGPGVNAVHVYAFPADASGNIIGAPTFGAATYGFHRGDVATAFGNPGFANSGFALRVRGLTPGNYQLVVYARSSVTKTPSGQDIWNTANTLVSVRNAPLIALDSPVKWRDRSADDALRMGD